MLYRENEKRIELSASELVYFARDERAISYSYMECGMGTPASESKRLQLTQHADSETLYFEVERGGFAFTILSEVDSIDDVTLTFIREVPSHPDVPSEDTVVQLRGEAYCAGYIFSKIRGRTPILKMVYYSEDCPVPAVRTEEPNKASLATFFDRLMEAAEAHAAPEIDRVSRRLPLLKKAPFPYPNVRDAQQELMEECYTTIRRHSRLYACAPTGTGKTMSVLYPAVRAIGEGLVEKAFYLTPKNTTAMAAVEALRLLDAHGAPVRGIWLTAKERICPMKLVCREGIPCNLSPRAPGREDKAARELLAMNLAVVGDEEILAIARKYSVCPYEVSLRYSMYCDVIIGDYNYLFDVRVYLRRYFDRGGHFTFLVDEAHNLVERSREMYTARFTTERLDALENLTKPLEEASRAVHAFRAWFDETLTAMLRDETNLGADGRQHGFAATSEPPEGMYGQLCSMAYALTDLPKGVLPDEVERELRPMAFDVMHDLTRLSMYDERYKTFYEQDGESYRLSCVCLDAANAIDTRLSLGDSAIFFSATLTPTEYYRDVLGGDQNSRMLELESPFDRDHLSVAVMDKISTRYLNRDETVREVVRAILTTVKAKPGNYMVFCPSYAYMMKVVKVFEKAAPGLPILVQERDMSRAQRDAFLAKFDAHPKQALIGFCVMGGIYGEGIDLVGKRLIGAIIVGVGLPSLTNEREAIREYFENTREAGREYAYIYPGMNRVLQAAGRVIRTEEDRGVVLLIDDRFAAPEYKKLIPPHWRGLHFVGDAGALGQLLARFWKK